MRSSLLIACLILLCAGSCSEEKSDSSHSDSSQPVLPQPASSQSASVQSLSKHSHAVFQNYNRYQTGVATGFYVRSKDGKSVLFFTNHHVVSGVNSISGEKDNNIDVIAVTYPSIRAGEKPFIEWISVTRFALQEPPNLLTRPDGPPDLVGIQIAQRYENANYGFINDLIDSTFFDKTPERLYAFGYAKKDVKDDVAHQSLIEGEFSLDFSSLDSLINTFPNRNYLPKNYTSVMKQQHFIIKGLLAEDGFSGSPVFGRFTVTENGVRKPVYKFMGVIFGTHPQLKFTWVINGKSFMHYLNGRFNNR